MLDNTNIGSKLKELRMARGYRQADIADKVGLSRPAICNIEAGKRSLTLSTLKRFCEIYKIDISYFGIETDNFDEAVDLTTRLEKVFNSNISDEQKEDLYKSIMKIAYLYLENKK